MRLCVCVFVCGCARVCPAFGFCLRFCFLFVFCVWDTGSRLETDVAFSVDQRSGPHTASSGGTGGDTLGCFIRFPPKMALSHVF